MLISTLIKYVEERLHSKIMASNTVNGGSINQAWCLETASGKYFIKLNNKTGYPGMFEAEVNGLALIRATKTIMVPKVIFNSEIDNVSFLLLEWIDARRPTTNAYETLGRQLAAMHQCTEKNFGLDCDNYMGSLRQSNKKHISWFSFFVGERLQPMVKMAVDKGKLNNTDAANFERLYKNLANLFDEEPPALIHGDLWSGNYLIDINETPYLIDPAVSYGNREFDIAMTTLFGGLDNGFYAAYNEVFPLAKGSQERIDLWNLYPLLVHLNLFGSGYLGQVRECLMKYL